MKPHLSIVIVKYKSDSYFADCLQSIGKNPLWETIIVDNDKNNVGYGAGCNLGAQKAKGKYLLFLNPDTMILSGALEQMVKFLEDNPRIGILGPKIYNSLQKDRQLSFCRFPGPLTAIFVYSPLKSLWPNSPFWKRFVYKDKLNVKEPMNVEAVSGAALMVRKDIFKEIGGFDHDFFLYFEENDFCRRAQKLGTKIVFLPDAEIVHFGGKSTLEVGKSSLFFRQSRLYFFQKHYGILLASLVEGIIRFLEESSRLKKRLEYPAKSPPD